MRVVKAHDNDRMAVIESDKASTSLLHLSWERDLKVRKSEPVKLFALFSCGKTGFALLSLALCNFSIFWQLSSPGLPSSSQCPVLRVSLSVSLQGLLAVTDESGGTTRLLPLEINFNLCIDELYIKQFHTPHQPPRLVCQSFHRPFYLFIIPFSFSLFQRKQKTTPLFVWET